MTGKALAQFRGPGGMNGDLTRLFKGKGARVTGRLRTDRGTAPAAQEPGASVIPTNYVIVVEDPGPVEVLP